MGGDGARIPSFSMVVLMVTVPLAGCIAEPDAQLTVRRGDLVEALVVLTDGGRIVFPGPADRDACPLTAPMDVLATCAGLKARYVVDTTRPAELPDGWTDASVVPPGLVGMLTGLARGEELAGAAVVAFGPHDDTLLANHTLDDAVPLVVEDQRAYGRTWNGTSTRNGSFRIELNPSEVGQRVRHPDWCGERWCLFGSTIVGSADGKLLVRHEPRLGDNVSVANLDTHLAVTELGPSWFVVDGNHPEAGRTLQAFVRIDAIEPAPTGAVPAPPLSVRAVNGSTITLDELEGHVTVLEFFTTWCPSCIKNLDHLKAVHAAFGHDVTIVSIDIDPWEGPAELEAFADEHDVTWTLALDADGEATRAYRVGSLSTEVVLDAEGRIVLVETGVADHERVMRTLRELVGSHDHGGHG